MIMMVFRLSNLDRVFNLNKLILIIEDHQVVLHICNKIFGFI